LVGRGQAEHGAHSSSGRAESSPSDGKTEVRLNINERAVLSPLATIAIRVYLVLEPLRRPNFRSALPGPALRPRQSPRSCGQTRTASSGFFVKQSLPELLRAVSQSTMLQVSEWWRDSTCRAVEQPVQARHQRLPVVIAAGTQPARFRNTLESIQLKLPCPCRQFVFYSVPHLLNVFLSQK